MATSDPRVRAQELCAAARKLPPAVRASFLAAACGDDENLRSAVEVLLAGATVTLAYEDSAVGGEGTPLTAAEPQQTNTLLGAHLAAPSSQFPALPGYELLQELGRGGMGVVFKARQIGLNRLVALKLVLAGQLASDEAIRRFRTEAQEAANLNHVGIVPVYEVNSHAGWHYYSMGLVEGPTLAAKVAAGPLCPREAAELTRHVAAAVHYAHTQGVIHRDLKPSNILLGADGLPRVTDFGLAKRVTTDSGLTLTGQVLGTPSYMSPEQAAGELSKVGAASDIYSLGGVLYCLVTGRPPFQAVTALDTIRLLTTQDPVPPRKLNAAIPRDLEIICLKCLEKSPGNRYASAGLLADDLRRFLEDEPITARPVSGVVRAWRWGRKRRKPLLAVAAAVMVLGLAAWAALTAVQSRRFTAVRGAFEQGLEAADWSAEHVARLDSLAADLERFEPGSGVAAGQRVTRRLEDRAAEILRQQTLAEADVRSVEAYIALLARRDHAAAVGLRQRLAQRTAQQQQVFHLAAPFGGVGQVFTEGEVKVTLEGLICAASPPPGQPARRLLTRVPCQGEVSLEAEFGPEWEKSGTAGLVLYGAAPAVLTAATGHGYEFVVRGARTPADPAEAPPGEGAPFTLEILRHGKPLRRQEVRLPTGRLRLLAARRGHELTMQVNNMPPLKFFDAFPLAAREAGVFGVIWPAGARLLELAAQRQLSPPQPSALEQADALFGEGEVTQALRRYEEVSRTATGEGSQAARLKAGICLAALNRADEAAARFEEVMREPGPRWPFAAACQLWRLRIAQRKLDEADALLDDLQLRQEAGEIENIALLLPDDARAEIVAHYSKMSGGGNLFRPDGNRVRNAQRMVQVHLLLDEEGILPWAYLQLARAQRVAGDLHGAADALKRQVEDPRVQYSIRAFLAGEYGWVLRDLNEPHVGMAALDALTANAPPNNLHVVETLRIERARLHIALGQKELAKAELEAYLAWADAAPEHQATYARFSTACIMLGFLRDELGDQEGAVAAWRRGASRGRLARLDTMTGIIDRLHAVILGSLAGELSPEQAEAIVAMVVQDTVPAPVFNVARQVIPARIWRDMWLTPRGRETARQIAYQSVPFPTYMQLPAALAATELVRQEAFEGAWTPEQEALAWNTFLRAAQDVAGGKLSHRQVMSLGLAWLGQSGALGWGSVAPQLDPALRGPAAYMIGSRYRKLNKPEAAAMFQQALLDAPAESMLKQLVEQALAAPVGK